MTENTTSMIAKSLVGIVSQGATWPMEYVKIIQQMNKNQNQNTYNLIKSDIRNHGLKAVYKSMTPQIISSVPRFIVRFTVYENMYNNPNKIIKSSAGVVAGITEAFIVMTPAEAIKIQLIKNRDKTITETLKNMWNQNGISAFWKGATTTMIRQGTTQGVSLYTNQTLHPHINPYCGKSTGIVTGIIGGTLAVLINNPIDVVKTRQQESYAKTTIISEIKNIYKNEGFGGYYKGAIMRITRVAPLHGLTYFVYDLLK